MIWRMNPSAPIFCNCSNNVLAAGAGEDFQTLNLLDFAVFVKLVSDHREPGTNQNMWHNTA